MASFDPSELRQKEYLVVKTNGQISKVIFPSTVQVGLENPGFNNGIVLPNLSSAPGDTNNALYAINGDIYFNGLLVAPSAGSNLTIKDEGTTLTTTAASINFVGSGITASTSDNNVTVTVTTEADGETQILASQVFG